MMAVQRMPRADLESRKGDWPLSCEQILRLSLFAGLRRKPNLDRFVGAVVVRHYRAGETICWQGEAGWTAFYVLTSEDILTLKQEHLNAGLADRLRLCDEIGRLRRRLQEASAGPEEQAAWRIVGTVHIATPKSERDPRRRLALLAQASGRPVPGTPVYGLDMGTLYVPVDGPATFSYDTMSGALCEGELFGETSCMYRMPRPGTVVATRDCFVLEILRNILDQMYKDPDFREWADLTHERQEAINWRRLSLLADLSDEQYAQVAGELRLIRAEPGTIICDENAPADVVCILRNGLVRVARKGLLSLETTLAYRGPGEWFDNHDGTCTACGHPNDQGMVEMVQIPAVVFSRILDMSPRVRQRVEREAQRRREEGQQRQRGQLWTDTGPVQASRRFEELGLIQGQQLMLIDLDRCTRCNECVTACVDSHADGLPRLALDGPRYGKYLVPMTCRSCLDPVCVIGCPVGSIHRGDNKQIVIEDWCIGCGLCAERCPYGSIQMQDLGIIPEASTWQYATSCVGEAPFRYDRELIDTLGGRDVREVLFQQVFSLTPSPDAVRYRLEVTSRAAQITVHVDGVEVEAEGTARQGRTGYVIEKLRAGQHILAVRVSWKSMPRNEVVFAARLDEVKRPRVAEDIVEKQVTARAATCDLCSERPGHEPACVRVCPHDAAMRVDGRREFLRAFEGG
jgi:Fe-S-cluster-containing hydrogenase component 2/CRP-like cAMP-binding protein